MRDFILSLFPIVNYIIFFAVVLYVIILAIGKIKLFPKLVHWLFVAKWGIEDRWKAPDKTKLIEICNEYSDFMINVTRTLQSEMSLEEIQYFFRCHEYVRTEALTRINEGEFKTRIDVKNFIYTVFNSVIEIGSTAAIERWEVIKSGIKNKKYKVS